ncbi:lipase maturation factor family protein [Antrihabitans sp. YC2-6]|uniref:lipase maturation factor family protein n=1 Tax=Antrihabitans sp. YC2-6 TaxID=2799498 RepID=UPI0018F40BD4|nr:lipase maturation factor family protein [Antrihabitans sp. YC2-6]MBJ8346098.1 lipase maturation factor family protein [Antrihabitans sp. YC2-6]
MEWLTDPGYATSRWVFQRTLAFVYLVAFLAAALQFRALIGQRGLTPVPRYLEYTEFRDAPSLFHYRYSDRIFAATAWVGVAIAGIALFGITEAIPLWASMLVWAVLWILYMSIVNVGQIWYGFGWESLLLEVGFLAIFLGNASTEAPVLVLFLLRWVLFRLEFGAGLIKLRGDPCWRNLTCLYYHHETQPLPGPFSWHFHHLPKPLHRMEVAANHFTQLVVPFGLFAPQPIASVAAAIIVVTQLWLMLSGNFSWLNGLTIVLALSVIEGSWWNRILSIDAPADPDPLPHWHVGIGIAVAVIVAVLSFWPVRNMLSSKQLMNHSFDPLHLVNTYGAFGSVTHTRFEVVISGTAARENLAEAEWKEYEFKGKPGDLARRPRQIAPYHLRLDWLMWFAAISPTYAGPWLLPLANKLLQGDRTTLKLFRINPFPDAPPAYIRATMYEYRFTDRQERRSTGKWWNRTYIDEYLRPVSLD